MLSYTAIILLTIGIYLFWGSFQYYYRKYRKYPPGNHITGEINQIKNCHTVKYTNCWVIGPVPWPIIGNALQMDQRHVYKSFQSWSQLYSTKLMSVKLGFQNALVINDSYRAKEIYGDFTFSGRPQCYFTQVLSGGNYGEKT